MVLFLFSILLTIIFLFLLCNLFHGMKRIEKVIGIYLITCAYGVFLFELSGLLNLLRMPGLILVLQILLVALISVLNRVFKIGFSTPSITFFMETIASFWNQVKRAPGLFVITGLVAVLYFFLAYLQVRLPQNNIDGLLNHLSRIAHWLQQGSIKTYSGFNTIGTSYPYNNSLLMMWSMIFLHSDVLVGFVQYFAALFTAITVYAAAVDFGFDQKAGLFSGLLFLTFPIILFESGTSQNDLLVASFLIISFYFLIRHSGTSQNSYLVLSILGFALAAGTNQYSVFALPGYLVFFIFLLLKNNKKIASFLFKTFLLSLVLFLLFGSFAYVQNWIRFGNPMGGDFVSNMIFPEKKNIFSGEKLVVNSLRLTYQFASCEGIPPYWETICIAAKKKIFMPVLVNQSINLEAPRFLLEQETPFRLDEHYPLNEESSWYGPVGFVILTLAFVFGLVMSIRKKKVEGFILLGTALFFFLCIALIKPGWDPYVGRYLIFSSALVAPFSAGILSTKRWYQKVFVTLVCILGICISVFCVINNDSKPLIGKRIFYRISWNEMTNFQKNIYKYSEILRHDKGVWNDNELVIRTMGEKEYYPVLEMINTTIPDGYSLAILNPEGYFFPDYLFFGKGFNRIIHEYTTLNGMILKDDQSDYLLVSPTFSEEKFLGYQIVDEANNWRLYINSSLD